MPGTILRNTTGPFVSQPFLIPSGHSLALSLVGTGFSAVLECTLDTDSTDWVPVTSAFTVTTLYNVTVGPVKFRLNLASGTLVSAQYSSALMQVVQTTIGAGTGPDYSGAIASVQATAASAQGAASFNAATLADMKRAPLAAAASTRGVIFRGGIAYYPAPAGLIADGVNVIDEGATGLYYRSSGDVLPWEYGALPGGEFVGSDNGAALAAWAAGAPNHSRLYLPPGHWWTGQSLVLQNTNLHLNFRGTLHAALGFTGYLVNADAGFTPAPAGQLPSYYDTTLGNALWYKRIQVEAMTLNGESRSKGVKFSRFDHYHISNVTVHKSYGHGIAMDRMREGNAYNFNILHSRAGPDNALFDLSEQGPADSTNVVNYFGIRIAVFTGRAMYYDSPFMTVQESANPLINASNLPGRFVNFYGLSVEDIIKGQGFKFDNVTTEFPDPTSDRIWIRRGRYINIRGGLINAGDITTGSVLRIGDSTLGQPVLSCLVDTDVYAFAGTGFAVKAEAVVNLNVTKEFWLSDAVKAIKDPAGGRVPTENRQPTLTRMPGSQSVIRAVNEIAGAGDSPSLQLGDGWGNNLLLAQGGTNSGYSQFLLKPAAANSTTFMGDTNGALWTSGTQIKLGSGTNKVAWAIFAPQGVEPYDKSVGSIAVGGSSAGWNPLSRATTFFPMFNNGVTWVEVNTGLVPTTAPANLAAAPTAADFNALLTALKTSKILV